MDIKWNHRVIKDLESDGTEYFAIHEVYYEGDTPKYYTETPIHIVSETTEGLRWTLQKMIDCLDKPVLTPEDFEGTEERWVNLK